ncbi:hypothetical protein [Vibrio mediterranei]|uniref:hypothetical protein n=1 Tax=Vibrio mediterranei TaxID=689 RepID=UPI00148C6FF2|nr:hypothetical protein [Vibrio mediterranei]
MARQQTVANQQPATSNQQPATSNQQPATRLCVPKRIIIQAKIMKYPFTYVAHQRMFWQVPCPGHHPNLLAPNTSYSTEGKHRLLTTLSPILDNHPV